jgi:hypothetical protein
MKGQLRYSYVFKFLASFYRVEPREETWYSGIIICPSRGVAGGGHVAECLRPVAVDCLYAFVLLRSVSGL